MGSVVLDQRSHETKRQLDKPKKLLHNLASVLNAVNNAAMQCSLTDSVLSEAASEVGSTLLFNNETTDKCGRLE